MSDSPYTKGWPKVTYVEELMADDGDWDSAAVERVVPLADAERMREALEKLASGQRDHIRHADTRFYHFASAGEMARAALNPERDK